MLHHILSPPGTSLSAANNQQGNLFERFSRICPPQSVAFYNCAASSRPNDYASKYRSVALPQKVVLQRCEPGIFLGGLDQSGAGTYFGIPQGADGNLLVLGGSGSGKTSGIAKPSLATWAGTIFAIDVKGELSEAYRAMYQRGLVHRSHIVFDPSDASTPSYDPFGLLMEDDEANIAYKILDLAHSIIPTSISESEPFWTQGTQQILAAALLYYYRIGLSFSEAVCKILTTDLQALCRELWACDDIQVRILVGKVDDNPKMLAAIDRGLRNHLSLFAADPCIAHAFRGKREGANTFTWATLETTSIFLRIPQDKLDIWAPALNLMTTQLIRYLESRPEQFSAEGMNLPPVLLLLDEFPRLGKLPMLANAIATLRSKQVNIALFAQSLAQIDNIYGEYERRVIADNCQFKAVLRADDAETQHYLAELIGTHMILRNGQNVNTDALGFVTGFGNQLSEQREHLIQPHELATLNGTLLLSPAGVFRICKLQPNMDFARLSLLASQDAPNGTDVRDGDLFRNEGALMLSADYRIKNSNAKCDKTLFATHKATDPEKTIGSLVIGMFPELESLNPNSEDGIALMNKLDAVLTGLVSDPDLLSRLTQATNSLGDV